MTRWAAIIYMAAMMHSATVVVVVHGFAPAPMMLSRIHINRLSSRSSSLWSANGSNNNGPTNNDEAQRLREKADQYRNEAEKLRLVLGLKKINTLENDIRAFMEKGDRSSSSSSSGQQKLQELKNRVEELVRGTVGNEEADAMLLGLSSFSSNVVKTPENGGTTISSSSSSPNKDENMKLFDPPTDEEIKAAISFLDTLPATLKNALAMAAGYKKGYYGEEGAMANMEEFVDKLYKQSNIITAKRLRNLYKLQRITTRDVSDYELSKSKKDKEYEIRGMSRLLASKIEERLENSTRAMELFPRSLQDADESILPSKDDADVIFQLLEKNFMATEKPVKVKGGYIIRGVNRRKSAKELLDALDGKLIKTNPQWIDKYQISFVEIYSDANEELFEDAILITPNTFIPMAPKLLSAASSAIAIFFSFVFCIDAFSDNTYVMDRLKEASEITAAGGTYDLLWFNVQLVPLLLTMGVAQGLHELSHIVTAWLKQVKLSTPTILPSIGLPYLSFQNRIQTSPKGYGDLFDIAFVGPVTGLSVSFLALLVGLHLTTTVDPTTAQLLPSLPVGYLTQSTLAGTIVDLILGGGDGILLNQDSATQIPLHPIAIGGFLGLIIHALDLVPVGSTDGGRMSQAILGRVWHLTFSSLVFLALFISSFTSDSTILLGYLFIYSFTQRDMEIPCRNEVDKVELPRAVAALSTWLLAALILVPLR